MIRLAVVNQHEGGGATEAAREVLSWGPERGIEVLWRPAEAGPAGDDALVDDLRANEPDLVHVHCWYQSWSYGLLARLCREHRVLLTVHDVAVVNQYGTECWECYRNPFCWGCPALGPVRRWRPNYRMRDRLFKRALNRRASCHLVLPSEWMRRRLARTEWRGAPSTVIPYGIDTTLFSPGPGRHDVRGPSGPVVLCVANMYSAEDDRKGLPDLLEAFDLVRHLVPEATLVLAGRVQGIVPRAGVVLPGEVPRGTLPELYRGADVFCLPSRGDNLPLAALEAQACGLPVVATTAGGLPEAVADQETGLLVPPRDPASLGDALALLLVDAARRQAMGRAARSRAERLFSRARAAERTEALYRALLAEAEPRRP